MIGFLLYYIVLENDSQVTALQSNFDRQLDIVSLVYKKLNLQERSEDQQYTFFIPTSK